MKIEIFGKDYNVSDSLKAITEKSAPNSTSISMTTMTLSRNSSLRWKAAPTPRI